MSSRSEQIQVLYEIVTSINTELDLQDMLKKCLSIYVRKLNCLAGAVFKLNQHSQGENHYFKEIVSIPRRIHNNPAYKDAIKQIPQEPNKQILNKFYKYLPISLHISENHHCHIMNLPGFGLIIFLKGGEPLKVDLLNSLLALNSKIADACKSRLNIEALGESEEKYRTVFENTDTAMMIIEGDKTISITNTQLEKLSGYSKEEMENKMKWTEFIFSEDLKTMEKYHRERRKAGDKVPIEYEFCLIDKKGNIKNILLKVGIIHGSKKSVAFLIDITERKQAEQNIKRAKDELQMILDSVPAIIFYKDTEGRIIRANKTLADSLKMPVKDMIGKTTEELLPREQAESMRKDDQVVMISGKAKRNIIQHYETPDGIRWLITDKIPYKDKKGKVTGVIDLAKDITVQRKSEQKLKQTYQRLKKTMDAALDTMSRILEAKDPYTAGHQQRVSQLAVAIAKELNFSPDKIEGIRIASLIHDIGKIGLPTEILSKPTKLTDIEFSLIKGHSQIGYDILKSIDFSYPIAQIVLQHHERLNGSGYPNNLKGDEILLEAKIIGVADVVEAMSSFRPYRPALGIDAALEEISKNKGILYDPKVVKACVKLFRKKGFEFE